MTPQFPVPPWRTPDWNGSVPAADRWPGSVGAADAAALAARIWDPGRVRPLVILSPVPGRRPRLLLDPHRLAGLLGDDADLVVLADHDATQALCAMLPGRLRFGTGSVRIFFPDADRGDHPRRHPWIFVEPSDPERAQQVIVGFLRQEPVTVWSSCDGRPTAVPDPLAEVEHDLAEARARISALAADRKRLQRELTELRQGGICRYTPPIIYADPAVQFRYEIEQHWLSTLPEKERAAHPLAEYLLGPDFLDSLAALQVVRREAVLTAVVDVLTGQVSVKNGRRTHRQRVGRGGGTAPLVRADGAAAWRCDIRNSTPAAPRLLWWVLPDGRIELAKAAVHDDHAMR